MREIKQEIERLYNFFGPTNGDCRKRIETNWESWARSKLFVFLFLSSVQKLSWHLKTQCVCFYVCSVHLVHIYGLLKSRLYIILSCYYCPIFHALTSDFRRYHAHITHSFILPIHFEEFQTLFGCFSMMPLRLRSMNVGYWTWTYASPLHEIVAFQTVGKRAMSTLIICARNVTHETLSA